MSDTVANRIDGKFSRELAVADVRADIDARTVELSFASELPVERGQFMEVLSLDPNDVDLTRLNDSHPLLLNHDPERQIGVVESARVDADKKARAVVRFSKSQLGDEIWRDVKDGIRRLVSVGYRRVKELASEMRDGREFVRFAWQPYEVSIVSVPADATVGIGRSQPALESQPTPAKTMSAEVKESGISATQIKEMQAIARNLDGKVPNIRTLLDDSLAAGETVDQFRAKALNALPTQAATPAPKLDVKPADWSRYSISRAICGQMSGKLDGFEREMSDECALKYGKKAEGFWLPDEALAKRNAIAGTGTLGGMLVSTPNLGGEFVELLRNRARVLQLGARTLNLSGPVTISRQNGAATVNAVGETVAGTLSGVNFTQFTLTPQAICAVVQYGKQLLMESNPSIDSLLRDDVIKQLAIKVDLAAIHGSGSGEPTGIVNTTGINTVALKADGQALGNATAYPALVSLESLIAADNADVETMAYLMRASHKGSLKTTQRFSSTDTPVWDPRSGNTPVNGYRAEVTEQLATNLTTGTATTICSAIIFGDWSQLIVANFGPTDINVNPHSLDVNRVVRIVASRWFDIGVRHPESFAVLGGIL